MTSRTSPVQGGRRLEAVSQPKRKGERSSGKAGYSLQGMFRLPNTGWQEEYYDPMMRIVSECRKEHGGDPELSGLLDTPGTEAATFRKFFPYYGYAFFIARVG